MFPLSIISIFLMVWEILYVPISPRSLKNKEVQKFFLTVTRWTKFKFCSLIFDLVISLHCFLVNVFSTRNNDLRSAAPICQSHVPSFIKIIYFLLRL